MSGKSGNGEKIKAYLTDIKEFKPDPANANRHTLRGRAMVEKGMKQRGYARPAFAASDGTVLGGNLSTMEVAPGIGLGDGKVFVVESDGTIPIIHKRVDVEAGSSEAKLLALEDNRTGEVSLEWDVLQITQDLQAGLDLDGLWDGEELSKILDAAGELLARDPTQAANDPNAEWQGMPGFDSEHQLGVKVIIVHFNSQKDIDEFAKLVGQKITDKTRYIWFPAQEKERTDIKVYSDES